MNRTEYNRLSKRLQLGDRQLEVARLAVQGLTTREMGNRLFLTEQTIKFHLTGAYQKLGVHGRIELLYKLVELGLIPCPFCSGEDHDVIVDGRKCVRESSVA
jgi:DNA-binding NarL/FixJ family response regulator